MDVQKMIDIDHELKCLPCFFRESWGGKKLFEIRDDVDRAFQRGQVVCLKEHDLTLGLTEKDHYTGREIIAKITFVTGFEQKQGFVAFGFEVLKKKSGEYEEWEDHATGASIFDQLEPDPPSRCGGKSH